LVACIIIPVPVDHTRGRAVDSKAIEVGVTTKDEIFARGGEPDAIWEDERIVVYSWEHANWLVVGAVINTAGAAYQYSDQFLFVQFDETGRVARAERVERPRKVSFGTLLRSWAKGEPHGNP
jgi:hypothetical protein